MKASKFSGAQKAFILKQGNDGVSVAELCRKVGISPATYFNWKKKYDGLLPTEMRRLKQLEEENGKLRVVDLSLDKGMLQGWRPANHACRGIAARGMMRSLTGKSVSTYVERFAVDAGSAGQRSAVSRPASQFQGSRALIWLIGWSAIRARTSRSQASGLR